MSTVGTAWFAVTAFALVMYSLLAGYSVGLGIALLLQRGAAERRRVVEMIGTAWDGNETWLILVAVALWGGFPNLFAILLPHVFIPGVVMLLAIGVRGLAIELATSSSNARGWGWTVGIASVVMVAAQGLILGAIAQPIRTREGAYTGSAVDFFSPFPVLVSLMLLLVVWVQGTAYLRQQAEGALQMRAARQGRVATGLAMVFVGLAAVSLQATPGALRLDEPATVVPWGVLTVAVATAGAVCWWTFPHPATTRPWTPFLAVSIAVVSGWIALIIGRFPVLLPPELTVAAAQSPRLSLNFLLVGVGLNIPLLLVYNWHAYRTFRGPGRAALRHRPEGQSLTAAALSAPSSQASAR